MKRVGLKERFWSKVDKHGPKKPHMKTRCWVWIGGKFITKGYGRMKVNGAMVQAHRLSFALRYGTIPDEMCVLHACDNRACVRPSHLHIGTQLDNVRERDERGRTAQGDHVPFERRIRGERQHRARLTEQAVREIRRCRRMPGGITLKALAERFDVTIATIWKVVNYHVWRHV